MYNYCISQLLSTVTTGKALVKWLSCKLFCGSSEYPLGKKNKKCIPQEAGKGSDECIDANPAVSQGNAENQQIAGCSELFDFPE